MLANLDVLTAGVSIQMSKRTKSMPEEYSINHAELHSYKASVDASINHEVRDPKHYRQDATVYEFDSRLEFECKFICSENRIDEQLELTVHGSNSAKREFGLILKDCHVRDDEGTFKYHKVRGKELPVYDVPKGVGYIERQRGAAKWRGAAWVNQTTIANMLSLLTSVQSLYFMLHERKVNRTRWLVGISLQTYHPDEA